MPSPLNVPGRAAAQQVANRPSPALQQPPPQAGEYYEDVDPRFLEQASTTPKPTSTTIKTTNSYEDIQRGPRSPAVSEGSNFTSISQRSVNPRYNSPPPLPTMGPPGSIVPRRPVNRNDMILDSNPDFELPGARSGGKKPGASMIPGSAYPAGAI
jgi:hypothetical protein